MRFNEIDMKNAYSVACGVARIVLAQDKFTLIDEGDLAIVAPFRWRARRRGNTCYAVADVRLRCRTVLLMHRLLCRLEFGDLRQVRHRDDDGLNNTRANLRVITDVGRNAAQARYSRTEKGKAAKARYNRTEKGVATSRATVARYRRTKKGRATAARYSRTEKGVATSKATMTRYLRTEAGRAKAAARQHVNRAIRSGSPRTSPACQPPYSWSPAAAGRMGWNGDANMKPPPGIPGGGGTVVVGGAVVVGPGRVVVAGSVVVGGSVVVVGGGAVVVVTW